MRYIPWGSPSFEVKEMLGKTFKSVAKTHNDRLVFTDQNGDQYIFHHYQGCCESVDIADLVGDLEDFEGSPLLEAEVSSSSSIDEYDSNTWTFYKFGTIKGHVNIRWFGASNGYYSETVDQTFVSASEPLEAEDDFL